MTKNTTRKVAVLITCFNRKDKTINFLDSLINQQAFAELNSDIYLLDDASTDGTAQAVKYKYPQVSIITGTGHLFWAGGMRTIWQYAISKGEYTLFLLFNDDVVLMDDAIERLMICYNQRNAEGTLLVGSTLSPITNELSYGGHALYKPDRAAYYMLKPDKVKAIPCQLGNANIFLVDALTVRRIGIFSAAFTHYLADFDYTLSAHKGGIDVLVAPGYYGYCEDDHGVNWLSGKYSLKKRINYLYNVKGLAYKEYLYYIKKHFPADYFGAFTKLWLKTLFPVIWDKFKKQ
ncbi:glycosyltransferase family 2 protein [Mucilaginibacter segetis]|uniref:Glycosyltransferase family 2 protein n=1 Tax=Mucilaginibacter segetis TaxID=2793071 RepID=A0A934PW82_9SPHI|nr:glycosyltransferase [Mucilaginibacter segetis]MBK0380672.1 glycosyltransferase family 2 protein [Mucilaginibacter segetis]